jgi:hypothetical protein
MYSSATDSMKDERMSIAFIKFCHKNSPQLNIKFYYHHNYRLNKTERVWQPVCCKYWQSVHQHALRSSQFQGALTYRPLSKFS